MARTSKWNKEDRSVLLKMVKDGVSEQEIRQRFPRKDGGSAQRSMSAAEFAQQLKQAMVEAGEIKQSSAKSEAAEKSVYSVTSTGRLTISDFQSLTGAKEGAQYVLEKPRGRSKAWRLVEVK